MNLAIVLLCQKISAAGLLLLVSASAPECVAIGLGSFGLSMVSFPECWFHLKIWKYKIKLNILLDKIKINWSF